MDSMTFGKYIPVNSIIHRLDPRLKIGALLIFLIAVFFDAGFIGYGILTLFVLLVAGLSNISIKHILKAIKPMVFMMLFLMVFNIFLVNTGEVVFTIGSFDIYSGALIQSAYIFIRLILIITMTTILTSSTKPLDLTLGIESMLSPFKRFGFPAHELAMMISIALRFIPDLLDEAKRIMKAQASRGVDFNEGKLTDKIKAIVSLIIPLFISAFQRAEDLANAMESRNYNPEAPRTRYKSLKWQKYDTFAFVLTILVSTAVITMSFIL
ncbi:energy-coupling factor transporter transmembrane protein EcfT [Thomasclavelia sp.]|uniref:energy-coupling factor transporter transmembrane component T family protein n=1 Tax=Thomasclavelia sp. TaxID=3025757 RepID=UPI0025DDEE39|nr:energy-coupling factor transporter transmembrane component T [Thomasclavelia sp.]